MVLRNVIVKNTSSFHFLHRFQKSFSKIRFNGTGGLLDVFEMHVLNTSGSKGLWVLNKSSGL